MRKILIVDDDPVLVQRIRILLQSWGYYVGFLNRPEYLIQRLSEEQFDLILLDVFIPGISGLSLMRMIRNHSVYKHLPVVMMTAEDDTKILTDCFEAGTDDFLYKPIREVDLRTRINSALDKAAHLREIERQRQLLETVNIQLETEVQRQISALQATNFQLKQEIESHSKTFQTLQRRERLFHSILMNSYDPIFGIAKDRTLMFVSPSCERVFGYTPEEWKKNEQLLQTILHPECLEQMQQYWAYYEQYGRFQETIMEWVWFHKNGSLIYTEQQYSNLTDETGQITGCMVVIRDITERKQMEIERERFFTLSLDMFCIADFDGYFKRLNPAWQIWLGWNLEELQKTALLELVHPDDYSEALEEYQRLIHNPDFKLFSFENRYRHANGSYRWLSWNACTYGETRTIYAVARDVTERKQMEEALHLSEARFRRVIEGCLDSFYLLQSVTQEDKKIVDFLFLDVNQSAERQFGMKREKLIGGKISEILSPIQKYGFLERYTQVLQNNSPLEEEYCISPENELNGWFYHQVVPWQNGVAVFNRSIAARKKLEQELREKEARTQAILNTTMYGIITIDEYGVIDTFNTSAANIFGYVTEEIIGRSLGELMPSPYRAQYNEYLKRYRETGQATIIGMGRRVEGLRKSGQVFPMQLEVTEAWIGQRRMFTGVVRDTTEEERIQQLLRQNQKLEAIGNLAGGIAHDFNNLLFAILGYITMAREFVPADHEVAELLENGLKACRRAKELVQHILTFSRQTDQPVEPTDLRMILEETFKLMRPTLPSTIDLIPRIEAKNTWVLADPTQIHQMLVNLCTNAGYAMREKGGQLIFLLENVPLPETQRRSENLPEGEYLRIAVQDTGIGIAAEHLERIFDPFFTTKPVGEGTGMGLAVVHGIVRNLRGVIMVESQLGKGSQFSIFLPTIEKVVITEETSEVTPPRGNAHILLVDDERYVLEAETQLLKHLGYRVSSTIYSLEALEWIQQNPNQFDLMITDQTMPNMTGNELVQAVLKVRSDLPVILLTGFSYLIDEAKAKKVGVRRFLMKPVTLQKLAEAIVEALAV